MIAFIVKRYQAVFVFSVMTVILGWSAYQALPRESAPEIRRPLIFVTTSYPGVSPKDIEALITEKIELEIDGLEGLEKLDSTSYQGLSQVVAEFRGDIDVELALRRTKERVDIAKSGIPSDAEEPVVKELNFSDQPFLIVTISNPLGIEKLESYSDALEELIEGVHGVQDVVVSGKLERELEIAIDPLKLKHYGLALEDVTKAIHAEHISIPGGRLKTKDRNYSLSVSGEIKDPEEFKNIIVKNKVVRIKLGQIAKVSFSYADPDSIARLNGLPAISLAVKKRAGENMIEIVDEIKKIIATNKSIMPEETKVIFPFDESEDVRRMVSDLENNILSGLLLVLLVTLFFLGPINASFVSLAIPFSMLISFFVLQIMGITLNMVVLFSLVIALGMLVDNGIVIVENIYRHANMNKTRTQAAIDGATEVAVPIITSTITTVLAFFPIIFMPDIMGEFMSYLPKTVIIVLSASLFVGLTITTVFCSRFLRAPKKASVNDAGKGFQRFQEFYRKSLKKFLAWPKLTLVFMFIWVLIGMWSYGQFGRESIFFSEIDPKIGLVKLALPSGTPLDTTDKFTSPVEALIQASKGSIDSIQSTIGTSAAGRGGARDSFRTTIRINYKPFLDRKISSNASLEDIKANLKDISGAEVKVEKMENGPPKGNDISYEIIGEDYDLMGSYAERILKILQSFANLENTNTDYESAKPEYKIEIDREKARRLGFSTRLIAQTIRSGLSGSKEGILKKGQDEYDIVVRFDKSMRSRIEDIGQIEIVHEGKRVPLSTLAQIKAGHSLAQIKRKERHRSINVYADFIPDSLNKELTKNKVEEAVNKIALAPGYKLGKGEGQEVRNRSTQFLMRAFMIALFLIFLVLVLQFNSVTQPMIILASVFLSLGGVFWGFLLSGKQFVIIMSGIGVISLAGVVVNNAIVLMDFINTTKTKYDDIDEAIINASMTRLRPVLLTAITTVIGLLPMAVGISFDFFTFHLQVGSESSEWWSPMAWTIIFGLSFATVLTLILVPCLMKIDHQFSVLLSRKSKS